MTGSAGRNSTVSTMKSRTSLGGPTAPHTLEARPLPKSYRETAEGYVVPGLGNIALAKLPAAEVQASATR